MLFRGLRSLHTSAPAVWAAPLLCAASLATTVGDAEAAFPGENGKIAFTKGGAIFRAQADGDRRERLTDPRQSSDTRDFDTDPNFGPDGREIVFVRVFCRPECSRSDIFQIDADGSDLERLTRSDGFETFASFSPSGEKIAFARDRTLFKMKDEGGGKERLTEGIESDRPVWSPLGDEIAFESPPPERGEPSDIHTVGRNGGETTNLTQTPGQYEGSPDWSPDGDALVATCGADLCRVPADGDGATTIASDGDASLQEPVFSPDRRKIAYIADHDEAHLFTARADGSSPRDTGRVARQPSWQPR